MILLFHFTLTAMKSNSPKKRGGETRGEKVHLGTASLSSVQMIPGSCLTFQGRDRLGLLVASPGPIPTVEKFARKRLSKLLSCPRGRSAPGRRRLTTRTRLRDGWKSRKIVERVALGTEKKNGKKKRRGLVLGGKRGRQYWSLSGVVQKK
jgi:hypothetical protein